MILHLNLCELLQHGPGLEDGHVEAITYPPEVEDFGSKGRHKNPS